ncbi:regulatory protein RecX [Caproicibacterium lactatifermentans]|uniref:Regulatory protein RecX n=1 Tax=Caproicibacterium lactatifermentans TaxID=2666138 RepID=A0A859DR14_9FIRM|nr:regulatory protein RecX [Caproicibacterium lactatifermentans]QKN24547.1 regulatory protein RecX [Caproicibacterium lactatifermentans]
MELTAMEPRRHCKTALFFDGEYALSVDTETLLKAGWKLGQDISDEELHTLLQQSDAHRASEKALYLLEHRSHSKKELTDKIAHTVPRAAAEAAAQKMEDLGLIDDANFAQRYARELYRKGFALRRVRYELARKGINPQTAEQAALQNEPDVTAAIQKVLQKKYRTLADEKSHRRAAAALQRMGYEYTDIRTALKQYMTNEDEE